MRLAAIFICFLIFSGFDWGWGSKKEASEEKISPKAAYVKKEVPANKKEMSSKRTVQPVKNAGTTAGGSINPEAIATATRVLGSGTPEERQARMESLKRLGEALRKKQS